MLQYRTPGVYFEWLDKRPPAIVPLRTDIAGFVGIAASGPLHVPVRIESFTQFTSTFGGHTPQGYLAYAVEGFFANGGQTCWVVRVADPATARAASVDLLDELNKPTLRLKAISRITKRDELGRPTFQIEDNPGRLGENITFTLSSTARDRFSLIIRLGNAQEVWRDLSLHPPEEDPRNVEKIINDKANGSNLVHAEILDSPSPGPLKTPSRVAPGLRGGVGRLKDGADGLTKLTVNHFTGVIAAGDKPQGLAALELIDEVSVVAMPDIMPKPVITPAPVKPRPHDCTKLDRADFEALYGDEPWPTLECCLPVLEPKPPDKPAKPVEFPPQFNGDQILFLQASLIAQCEKLKDRMAVLDMPLIDPKAGVELTPELAQTWRTNFDTTYAAIYYPWLRVPDPLNLEGILRSVPPSGHVAGIYARGDRRVGVHKPPANEELEGVKDVQVKLEDVDHGALNDRGVNVIRSYRGRGVRVAGARTFTAPASEWRYVNVRRLLIMIEEAIDEQTQWTVFEPNSRDLWRDIERVARSFLESIWRQGMLDGATPEEAFFVRCDEATNPQAEIDVGRVTCEIGVLPPWPAEFVVVRIGKTEGGTEIIEEAG